MKIEILFSFLVASSILTLAPGPDIIYVLTQSLRNGKKSGFALSAGLVCGIVIHTMVVAFGLGSIISQSPILLSSIQYLGAAYLLFLALKNYQHRKDVINTSQEVKNKSQKALFKEGFIMNILNPKVTIFFLAFFPGFQFHDQWPTALQFIILGGLFMIQAFSIFLGVSFLADHLASYIKNHRGFQLFMSWIQILVLIGIAVFILM
ncbi:MAG: LysE family translocator [Flavobacteriaceae bacterium]|nr:LysE family translocator [Flavobacteriaceae bacterium]